MTMIRPARGDEPVDAGDRSAADASRNLSHVSVCRPLSLPPSTIRGRTVASVLVASTILAVPLAAPFAVRWFVGPSFPFRPDQVRHAEPVPDIERLAELRREPILQGLPGWQRVSYVEDGGAARRRDVLPGTPRPAQRPATIVARFETGRPLNPTAMRIMIARLMNSYAGVYGKPVYLTPGGSMFARRHTQSDIGALVTVGSDNGVTLSVRIRVA